ncbi:MAG: 23S rRNA (uracil(1939)-C(5))-methyltransferase RlmD [Acidobacteriia bacterium]|nr:23S rRNA (uracil(1939)-C(5))-methyltransferase RlmD [Terriglobia bacterium]
MRLPIEKLVYGGDGLARLPADEHGRGKALFVPFVLEGEEVEVAVTEQKPGFARGRAEQILKASSFRVAAGCPYFQLCGGCHYQHAAYEHQLAIKTAILKENLRRIAKLELGNEIHVHPSPEWNYRNRTRLKVRTAPDFALGYFKFNSHELLPVEQCPISSPLINRAIAALWQTYGGRAFQPGKGLDGIQEIEFFTNSDDTQLLIEVYCDPLPQSLAEQVAKEIKDGLPEAAGVVLFKANASAHASGDPARLAGAGAQELTYKLATASYRVSAGSFFQVNRHLTDELVTLVVAGRSGRTALDLYAGVGLFSSVLSREFERVIAVESSPLSYADLRYNSPVNVKAVQAMSEQYLKNVAGKLQPDLVVVDPPRSGLGESVIHALVSLGAPRMTYVSCDPATLSRDLGRLLNSGYRVEQAHLVDLFPQTYHMESVFHLVR